MSSEQIIKKSLFGGFKKEGVINYIEKLQSEILKLKTELSNIPNHTEELRSLKAENEASATEIAALIAKIDTLKAENESLSERNSKLFQEAEELKTANSELEYKQQLFKEKISVIENKFIQLANGYISNGYYGVGYNDSVEAAKNEVYKANERVKSACNSFEGSSFELKSSVDDLLKALSGISEKFDSCDDKE